MTAVQGQDDHPAVADEMARATEAGATRLRPYSWQPVGVVAGITALAHLAVAGRYGWHRDELYYAEAGRHLAFGYVDQPPLTPIVARVADLAPGGVLPLRVIAILAQVGCLLLAAAIARELGGAKRAQVIAAACVAASPAVVASSLLLGTTILDQVAWLATIALTARALRTERTGSWAVVGVVAGIGLENKQTMLVLLLGLLVGFVVVRRDVLRRPGPWIAATIAFALWFPNFVWNARNGWPSLDMARVLADEQGGTGASIAQIPVVILGVTGLLVVVGWAGVRWLFGDPDARGQRWLLVVAAVAVVVFAATGGKLYYAAPALLPLLAAGGVALERRTPEARWFGSRRLGALVVMSWLIVTVFLLPFLPASDAVVADQRETYGWPQFARQVASVAAQLPPDTVVLTSNYGEAGAIARFGPPHGLDLPVRSGHNAYGDWGPDLPGTPNVVLAVGEFDARFLRRSFRDVERVAPVRYSDDVENEEIDDGAAIFVCRHPRGTWAQLWPELRHVD